MERCIGAHPIGRSGRSDSTKDELIKGVPTNDILIYLINGEPIKGVPTNDTYLFDQWRAD